MSLAQGNNTPTRPRIEPGSPDPESDALTTRPVRPQHVVELHDLQRELVTTPTRITAHSSAIIDHLYASSQDKITEKFVPNIAISDHFPICFTRSASKANYQRHTHTTIKYRCYKKFNEDDFLFDLSEALALMTRPKILKSGLQLSWIFLISMHR